MPWLANRCPNALDGIKNRSGFERLKTAFAHVLLGHHAMNTGADQGRFLFLSLPLLAHRRCLDTARGLSLVPFAVAKKAMSGRRRPILHSRLL